MGDKGRWLKLGDLVINADTIVGVRLDAKWSVVVSGGSDSFGKPHPEAKEERSGVVVLLRDWSQELTPDVDVTTSGSSSLMRLRFPDGSPAAQAVREYFAVRGGASEDVKLGAMLARHEGSPEGTDSP